MQIRMLRLLLVTVVAAVGCNRPNPDLVPVDGLVTLDGAPVSAFIVNFTPIGSTKGSGALGHTDDEGRFALTDVRGEKGAHPGHYKVSFYPALALEEDANDPANVVAAARTGLPAVYIDPVRTPLRATVPESGGTVEIRLTAEARNATTHSTPAVASQ